MPNRTWLRPNSARPLSGTSLATSERASSASQLSTPGEHQVDESEGPAGDHAALAHTVGGKGADQRR